MDRRSFLKNSLVSATAISLTSHQSLATETSARNAPVAPGIIDTNVNLFEWPFRTLKYRHTKSLVAKLKKHRIIEAWAGSFEALLSKDINGVNARLAAECREQRIVAAVRDARSRADVVVFMIHGGIEYWPLPSPEIRQMSNAAVRAGAGTGAKSVLVQAHAV